MNLWDQYVDENINQKVSILRAKSYFETYIKKDIWQVKRRDINNPGQKCFRSWLATQIESDHGKNKILFLLDRFYQFAIIQMKLKNKRFGFVNPFDLKFDKFKIPAKYSTYRNAIPKHIIDEMKEILTENDFAFGRSFENDYLGGVWSPSTTTLLYTMLTVPIRGRQAQLLDSGLGDECIYDFQMEQMVKNPQGEKGRSEGFVQMRHRSGFSHEKKESLWITTNKAMNKGYEIAWVSDELLQMVEYQLKFLKQFGKGEKRDKSVLTGELGNFPKFYCLFRDVTESDGMSPVSRVKICKMWKKLCRETEKRTSFKFFHNRKLAFGLHNLRVSIISYAIESGVPLEIVSKNLTGHANIEMTLYYARGNTLKDKIKQIESKRSKLLSNIKLLGKSK